MCPRGIEVIKGNPVFVSQSLLGHHHQGHSIVGLSGWQALCALASCFSLINYTLVTSLRSKNQSWVSQTDPPPSLKHCALQLPQGPLACSQLVPRTQGLSVVSLAVEPAGGFIVPPLPP